ncbi:MAG: CHAD domain-containing protein [Solirubrobacteraceae bacterium]
MTFTAVSQADRLLAALRAALDDRFDVVAADVASQNRSTVTRVNVLDRRQKTVARLRLTTPGVLRGAWEGEFEARHARLELTLMRGYQTEYDRVQRLLVAAGFNLAGASAAVDVPMHAYEHADVVVQRVLRRLLDVQDVNLPGALADLDSEFLHDLRVSIRRTRSVQRELGRVFLPADLAPMRSGFRWLQSVTGPVRDLDVYAAEFPQMGGVIPAQMRNGLEQLLLSLNARRDAARLKMERELVSQRARTLRLEWEGVLERLVDADAAQRPDAHRQIGELTGERVRRVYRRMVKMGERIDADSSPETYHELRKRGKELRYLLELFAGQLFDPEVVRPLLRALKGLQDVLGRHQDREVQVAMLTDFAREISTRPDAAGTLLAIGALIGRLQADAASARLRFAESFTQFSSTRQRAVMRGTFG